MPNGLAMSILLAVCVLPTVGQSHMGGGPQVPAPASIQVPGDAVTVPMQDMEGRPVIDVKIDGKGPYRFVLDTGASVTVVSDELGRELSLPPLAGVHVASKGGGPVPAIVMIHDIRIGNAVLEGVMAATMPLGGLLKGENAPRGVLSAANFPGYLLIYDYPGKRISIKKGALQSADSKSSFQYTEEQVLPTVPLRIAGHDTQVHLDAGSTFGLTLPVKFLTELPLASEPKPAAKVRTAGGEFSVSTARLNGTIELGKYKLDPDEVRFSDARPGLGPAAGNIGYEVLRHFVVTLDSKNRRILFEQ